MGKRWRALNVTFNEKDIQITEHAMRRFRQRVEPIPFALVPGRVAKMLETATPMAERRQQDGRLYFRHDDCVLVMTRAGVIITVLTHFQQRNLEHGTKEARKSKKQHKMWERSQRPRVRRMTEGRPAPGLKRTRMDHDQDDFTP